MKHRTMAAVIAEERTIKTRVDRAVTDVFKDLQAGSKLSGHIKTYRPVKEQNEDGSPVETFPAEIQKVQVTAASALEAIQAQLVELFRITEEKDVNNMQSTADIVIYDCVVAQRVPVAHLLWLEKQLTLLKSVIDKLPTLDPSECWVYDPGEKLYTSAPVERARVEKTQKAVVLYPATDKHPAQTQLVQGEVTVGYWKHTKTSGALPKSTVLDLSARAEVAIRAVKTARAEANSRIVMTPPAEKSTLLEFVFNGKLTGTAASD